MAELPESREDIEARRKVVERDLEIYCNSYWYEGKRLDPTKLSLFPHKTKKTVVSPAVVSPAWDRWLAESRGKKIYIRLLREKEPMMASNLTKEEAPTLSDFDSEVIVLNHPKGTSQVFKRSSIEHMNSYRDPDAKKEKES